MFGPHYIINNWQQLKQHTVREFVKDETLKQQMFDLIEAQTKFYHSAIDSSLSVAVTFVKSFELKK